MTIIKKPTPQQRDQLRVAYPKGTPRFDHREMLISVERAKAADGDAEGAVDGGADEAAEDANGPIPLSFSSEAPVLRYDWWEDELYYEVLDHSNKSIDLSYAVDGLPFIKSHQVYDADAQIGLVENVELKDKKLRGEVRMSESQTGQDYARDIRTGIRKKVSVGYLTGDEYTQEKGGADGIPIRRYTAWMPLECSTVPVPADYSQVGFDRAKALTNNAAVQRFLTLHSRDVTTNTAEAVQPASTKAASRSMIVSEVNTASNGGQNNEDAAKRVESISNLAAEHGCMDKLPQWIRSGASTEAVTSEINKILGERLKNQVVTTSRGVEVDDKDYKRFSYARVLLLDPDLNKVARENGVGNIDCGFEREMVQEAKRKSPFQVTDGRLFVPYVTPKSRANVDSATSTTGGPFKFTQPGDFIDLLRNKTSVMRAGATVLPGLSGPMTFPKATGAATASWVGENPGSDMSRSNLTTSTVSLAFKTVQAASAVSRQALFSAASGNYDLEQIIQADLARVIALAIDLGALNGSGSSNQPKGVLQDTAIGSVALGAQGGTMTYGSWIDLETAIGDANADTARMAYITNTKQRGIAKKSAVLNNTASGVPIWTGTPGEMDGVVNGYRAIASNQVPRSLVKGTVSTCSAVLFGSFEYLLIGMFGAGFEVLVDPYTLKLQNLIDITAWNFVDVANRYSAGFAAVQDAL